MAKKPTPPRKSPLGQFAETPAVPAQESVDAAAPPHPTPLAPTKHRETLRRELVEMVSRDMIGLLLKFDSARIALTIKA